MKLLLDDDLAEAVVFLCASGQRAGVPNLQVRRFHRERDRIYSILDPDDRNASFSRLHRDWFQEWGVEEWLEEIIARFPALGGALESLAFRKARSRFDEGAELYVNAVGQRNGVVALQAERFAEEDSLGAFLHHELMHLADMVDPVFGYSRDSSQFGLTASQRRVAQERYRMLWDVTIDGRLSRAELETVARKEQRENELNRAYGFLALEKRLEVFDTLWSGDQPRHDRLLVLACDPRGLSASLQPVPGAPCPLCGFATFDWADSAMFKSETVTAIQTGFATWRVEQGACSRCLEMYQAASGMELPATVCL